MNETLECLKLAWQRLNQMKRLPSDNESVTRYFPMSRVRGECVRILVAIGIFLICLEIAFCSYSAP